jgi:hypothetical protein
VASDETAIGWCNTYKAKQNDCLLLYPISTPSPTQLRRCQTTWYQYEVSNGVPCLPNDSRFQCIVPPLRYLLVIRDSRNVWPAITKKHSLSQDW